MNLQQGMHVSDHVSLVRPLGEGGMGSVWVGYDQRFDTEVAVKFITHELFLKAPILTERFRREARSAAKIKSPHVVQIFDHGLLPNGSPYMVMELLEGECLEQRLALRGVPDLSTAAMIIKQAAKALHAAHSLGIVHRDIKPGNIFLLPPVDGELFVKVLDFGIAKDEGLGGEATGLTETGSLLGTPAFMSPEQITKAKGVDLQADLWALAVVAYRMLTGRQPFVGETMGGVIAAVVSGNYAPASEYGVAPAFDAWMSIAFHADPSCRFPSALELANSFQRVCERVVAGDPTYVLNPESFDGRESDTEMLAPADFVSAPTGIDRVSAAEAPTAQTPYGSAESLEASARTLAQNRGASKFALMGAAMVALGAVATLAFWVGKKAEPDKTVSAATKRVEGGLDKPSSARVEPSSQAVKKKKVPRGMVTIPAGTYRVGCDPRDDACFDDEGPVHERKVAAFAIMKHEVTMGAYDACVANGACPSAATDKGCTWQRQGYERHPINCVSHEGAKRFCSSKGWRLPTEVEWEVAARGKNERSHPWGGKPPGCSITAMHDGKGAGCGRGTPHEVGSNRGDVSWAGVFDLGGNVREWTSSEYSPYPGGMADGDRSGMVNRGASYLMRRSQWARSYTRGVDSENTRVPGLGFRCASDG